MLCLSCLLFVSLQQRPDFRADVRLVRVDAEASVDGRLIDGLTKEDFRIRDDGARDILYFGHTEKPLDVILVFDASGSMRPSVEAVASVAKVALGELRPGDRVAVMAFDADTDLVQGFTEDLSGVEAAIRRVLARTFIANSQIQRAAADAARHFQFEPPSNRRRAVLVITDDLGSTRDRRALPDLWEADAVLSGLIVSSRAAAVQQRIFFPPSWFGLGIAGIAEQAGGDTIRAGDPADGFHRMMQRLRRRYNLHYEMPDGRPGETRTITVGLSDAAAKRHHGAKVRARTGYVVPK
jgi:Mg-chelatase subunit ChlD